MEQLSPPFRIALVAVLAVGALWMVALRPHGTAAGSQAAAPAAATVKPAPAPAKADAGPTAPGVKGLGRAIQHAHDAAAGRPTGDPVPAAAKPAQPSAAKPAQPVAAKPAVAKPVTPVPAAAAARPAVVAKAKPARPVFQAPRRSTLLLFAGAGADDAVARAVVRSLRGPRVRTIIAPLSHLGLYSALIGNIPITTSPTLLVIAPSMRAREIVGLPDRAEVQQALAAARR